ncbi:MAG: DUF1570 domain-containing protein [Planctomycetota bacterium]|nr:DUF1570 domain-containing protein [Planctomycetota bacterium]
MNTHYREQLAIAFTLLIVAIGRSSDAQEGKHGELQADFGEQLAQLADKCDELKLPDQAAITRNWLVERGSDRQYLFIDDDTDPHLPADDAPELVKFWHRKFLQLRAEHAEVLFATAGEFINRGDGTTAYQLLYEALHHDPTHKEARRVLGFGSPSTKRIARRSGTKNHPDFGWTRGRYWQIESEHYRITTNASADAGVELARKLEHFHGVWQQVFFRYWSADESLAERFRGGNARLGTRKKLAVVLFADRDEYVKQLQRYEPQIAMTLGYYMKGEQTAFFYAGDESVEPTWYHEATHQLFQELGDAIADVGEISNFWIVEGIAVYMESLVAHDGYMTLGGVDAERLQYARVRALTGEFYLPLAELVRLGREDLQRHQDIRHIYTQAAGLAHFLMDGTNRQHRQALVDFITLLYLGRAGPNTLAARCGVELETLDKEYTAYLVLKDADLVQLSPPNVVKNLALGHTEVTDAGIKCLADYTALQWLDLSFTNTTDKGLAHVAGATGLRRLNLEGTGITDDSLEVISRFQQLEELDLSDTKITDAGIARLSNMQQLKVLWLTKTQVSDACLEGLQESKQLEFLEVSQTNVTADGLAALKAKLPQLNRQ